MQLQIFAVYDKKAAAYLEPFFMTSKGMANRAFADAVNDGKSPFNKHPEDYALWYVGVWEVEEGLLVPLVHGPESMTSALGLVREVSA